MGKEPEIIDLWSWKEDSTLDSVEGGFHIVQCGVVDRVMDYNSGEQGSNPRLTLKTLLGLL